MKTRILKKPFEYIACGIPNVYLLGGVEEHETPYGKSYQVLNAEKVHELLARFIVDKSEALTGPEIRFLRQECDMMSQVRLGEVLGVSSQKVARWEKEQNIPSLAEDKAMRVVFADLIFKGDEKRVHRIVRRIAHATATEPSGVVRRINVQRGARTWKEPVYEAAESTVS